MSMVSSKLPIVQNYKIPSNLNGFYKPSITLKTVKNGISSTKLLTFVVLIISYLFGTIGVAGDQEHIGEDGALDTGSSLSTLTYVFVGIGVVFFLLIIASSVWLIRKGKVDNDNPITYMQKVNTFSRNARLYILHIQGMSLTYGVRSILYNFYLLYIFREGVDLFGYHFETVFFIGFLLALGSVVTGLMAPFNGIIVDRIGKKWSFISGDFLGAAMILVVIFFQAPGIVIGAQIFRSAVMSIHSIAEGPFIYEQSTSKERVHLFSVSSGMSTFASMSGNLIGGVIPFALAIALYDDVIVFGDDSIRVLQVGLFVSVLLWWGSLIPAFYLKEDPRIKEKAQQMSVSAQLQFKNVKHWKTIWVFVLSSVFIGLGAGMFASFFEIFFLLLFGATPAEIAIIFAIGALFVAIGNIVSPILAERFGKVNMIVITRMISIVFMILLPLSTSLVATGALFLAAVFYMLRGFFMNSTGPTEEALAMEVIDDEERTTLSAFRIAGASIFSALGFLVGGYYIGRREFVLPFVLAGILYFISTIVFWLYFKGFKFADIGGDSATPVGSGG